MTAITSAAVTAIGRIGVDPARPDRLTLFRADGSVSNRFACDDSRENVRDVLARNGLTLNDDDTVTRYMPA